MSIPIPPFRIWGEVGILMELYDYTFADALAYIAARYGISVAETEQRYDAGNPALRHNIDGRGQNRNPLAPPARNRTEQERR